jgi:hypothetical protein
MGILYARRVVIYGGAGGGGARGGGGCAGGVLRGGGKELTLWGGTCWDPLYFDRPCTRWMALAWGYHFPESEACGNETPGGRAPFSTRAPKLTPLFLPLSPPPQPFLQALAPLCRPLS